MTSPYDDPDSPVALVCAACRAGPFSYEGFRQAVAEFHSSDATGYSYTRTWQGISESVSNEACHWCEIVRRTRDGLPADRFPSPGEENVEIRLQVGVGIGRGVGIFLNGKKAASYRIYANPGDPAIGELGPKPSSFMREPYVDYEKAVQSIKACSDHEHCPTLEETNLPSRVIDCADPSKPRLFETHRRIKAHYCALSYVWGGEQHQKTTTSNIDTYVREGFSVPLPQTIADAIFVTNKLGCRYLWVDAFCIIQDKDKDKDKELADMAHIYRDAYVTISALSSFRADQGFLPDERPPDVLPFYVSGSASPGRMLMEYNIPRPTPGLRKYETVAMHTPLNDRGWCLQESILPPRRLIFQPPFISYKCPSFSEDDITRPFLQLRLLRGQAHPTNDYILFQIEQNTNPEGDEEELQKRWQQIISDYTRRRVTVPSDKLVALAGVAEIFGIISKDRYIGGLWQRTLLYDLLWAVWPPMGPDEAPLPRPSAYRAPSWSWASVEAKLHFTSQPPPSAASYEAEILACDVSPKSSALPFGEIADAKLTLKGKIRPLMRSGMKCSFTEIRGTSGGNQYVHGSLGWKWLPPIGNCLEPSPLMDSDGKEEQVTGFEFDSVEGTTPDPPKHFYVLILRAGQKWGNQGDWMHGLLVLPVDGEVVQYRRVAKLSLQYNFQWPDWFDGAPLKTVTLI